MMGCDRPGLTFGAVYGPPALRLSHLSPPVKTLGALTGGKEESTGHTSSGQKAPFSHTVPELQVASRACKCKSLEGLILEAGRAQRGKGRGPGVSALHPPPPACRKRTPNIRTRSTTKDPRGRRG